MPQPFVIASNRVLSSTGNCTGPLAKMYTLFVSLGPEGISIILKSRCASRADLAR